MYTVRIHSYSVYPPISKFTFDMFDHVEIVYGRYTAEKIDENAMYSTSYVN